MITKTSSLFTFCFVLLFSCTNENTYFQDVANQTWRQEDTYSFEYTNEELKEKKAALLIRYTENYGYQNLWLKIGIQEGDNEATYTRKELQLSLPDGRMIGKKKGAIHTLSFPLEDLSCADSCQLIIQQNMRDESLAGIQSVGVSFN